jgi:hypothetical protein
MEMTSANAKIRRVLYAFVTFVPLFVILSHGWGDVIRRLTTIGT